MNRKDTNTSASPSNEVAHLLDVIQKLRVASGALLTQLTLHAKLIGVEWAEEKNRLIKMMVGALLGFACLLSCFILLGIVVLWLSWDTPYRIGVAVTVVFVYAIGAGVAWHYVQSLAMQSKRPFAATREELAADIALLRSKL